MKVYRAIFRLDYRLSYSILDHLGEQLEFIQEQTSVKPYSKVKGAVDPLNHVIKNEGMIQQDKYVLTLALDNFNAVIDFSGGYRLDQLGKYPIFALADQVVERSELSKLKNFNRIGFRLFILDERTEFPFEKIKDYMSKSNRKFTDALSPHFESINDIGLSIESGKDDGDYVRVLVGPYQKSEAGKYFSLVPEVKEGLIIDIDLWQTKMAIPSFKLVDFVKYCQPIFKDLSEGTQESLLEVLR